MPRWLDADWLLGRFARQPENAIQADCRFVMERKGLPGPLNQTRYPLLSGDESFIERYQQDKKPAELREVSKAHRRSIAWSRDDYRQRYRSRNEAMARAYLSGAYTMSEIGAQFGGHYMTVSRSVQQFEQKNRE
ncbi:MAG: hypothetical protein ACRERU_04590 [Methylococcales bacterium]